MDYELTFWRCKRGLDLERESVGVVVKRIWNHLSNSANKKFTEVIQLLFLNNW